MRKGLVEGHGCWSNGGIMEGRVAIRMRGTEKRLGFREGERD
jgi:hypothetical protein